MRFYFATFIILCVVMPRRGYTQSTTHTAESEPEVKSSVTYPDGEWYSDGLRPAKKNGKFGFEDKNGTIKIPFAYDDAKHFEQGIATVRVGQKYGVINPDNVIVIPIDNDALWYFRGGFSYAKKVGKMAIITAKGKYLSDFVFNDIKTNASMEIFTGGLAYVRKENAWGIVDTTGKTLIPFQYDNIQPAADGLFAVTLHAKTGFIDISNTVRIPIVYDAATSFYEGYAVVTNAGLMGLINKDGKLLVAPAFTDISRVVREGLRSARKDGNIGFLAINGETAIPFIYSWADPDGFNNGKIRVEKDGVRYYINTKGERLP